MEYEINVCYKGKHLFATHKRSIKSKAGLIRLFSILDVKFPEQEGYEVFILVSSRSFKELNTQKFRDYVEQNKVKGLLLRVDSYVRKKGIAWLLKGFKY